MDLLPLAGSRASQAMRRACLALFGWYTDAMQAHFAHHRDELGMLPSTLGALQQDLIWVLIGMLLDCM